MKLIYRVTSRISVALLIVMAIWASLFYFIIIDEINDETDDALEDYSENIITRALAGETLPSVDNGTNNTYYIEEVTPEYARQNPGIRYFDEMIYLQSKEETEPARILKTIFRDAENSYFQLTVAIPTIEKEDLQETILWWIVFLYLLLLMAVIMINVIVLHGSFRPLYKLLAWLDHFKVDSKLIPLDNDTNVTEFRKLNEAMIRSAERNIETYEQQKTFIGNASHELQTPLAICKNRLEMLMEDPEITENQLEQIAKTEETLEHIIKLNRTLLLLSKIENRQFPDRKIISVNDIIRKQMDDYREVYAYRNITVELTEEAQPDVEMNETLATVMISNLLKNAYTHNIDGGTISITIGPSRITIANTGSEEPLDPAKIFKRFYQGTKKEGSTGLGLALTESIIKLYGMQINYHYSKRMHIFEILLP